MKDVDSHDPNGFLPKRIANRIGRPMGINPFPRAFENPNSSADARETFDRIHRENFWGSQESRSGVGSEQNFARAYMSQLRRLLENRKLDSVFDAPCGDLNWVGDLVRDSDISYSGGDISVEVVEDAKARFPDADVRVFDIISDQFPRARVWHCRDCLFHLPFAAISRALRNFAASDIDFALLTTHRARLLHRNLDVGFGGFRFLDLQRAPFCLPRPIDRISDYRRGIEFPRFVGLWSRDQIMSALSG